MILLASRFPPIIQYSLSLAIPCVKMLDVKGFGMMLTGQYHWKFLFIGEFSLFKEAAYTQNSLSINDWD